jgi:hypothetical protein
MSKIIHVFFFSDITPFSRPFHGISAFEGYMNRRINAFVQGCAAMATATVKQEK